MIYDRFQIHNYKYVIGMKYVYSIYATAIALTNMRIPTIMNSSKEMSEDI
jgi:ABC-type phosphate transport system permease subunit